MMKYPNFFTTLPTIKLQDPLSNLLGTFEKGLIEFTYLDIVKSAGHSCPTVSGAYLMTLKGLTALYETDTPIRGQVHVEIKEDSKEGVSGVIASVISHITGATEHTGFKGLNGNFARNNLMNFNADIPYSLKFTRTDTGRSVYISYDPSSVPPNPKQQELMGKIMKNSASDLEKKEFGRVWQERVEAIFIAHNNLIKTEIILEK